MERIPATKSIHSYSTDRASLWICRTQTTHSPGIRTKELKRLQRKAAKQALKDMENIKKEY
jgi:hypothetical protein